MKPNLPTAQNTIAPVDTFIPRANDWVQLRDSLSDYSADQALLLCETSNDRWVAWVPDYGEAVLKRGQFLKG
ncbi:MAG: hypothetical protein ACRC8A_07685 [Microcoleaceae cyanobacterium]